VKRAPGRDSTRGHFRFLEAFGAAGAICRLEFFRQRRPVRARLNCLSAAKEHIDRTMPEQSPRPELCEQISQFDFGTLFVLQQFEYVFVRQEIDYDRSARLPSTGKSVE